MTVAAQSTSSPEARPEVTIAIAVRNEQECVAPLIEEIAEVLGGWDRSFEVVIADDGSTDGTVELLRGLMTRFSFLRCYSLPAPQSKSAGLGVAVSRARGAWIITFDGDLQNDPRDIPELLRHAADDLLVCGARRARADTIWKKAASRIANHFRRLLLRDDAIDSGCGIKLFPRQAAELIPWIRGVHRFLPTVLKLQGYRVINVPVNDRQRTLGRTKYSNWGRLKRTVPDLFGFRWYLKRRLDLSATSCQASTDQQNADGCED